MMPDRILESLLAKYQTCFSYSDCGILYTSENGPLKPSIAFATQFQRPSCLRFEWNGQTKIKRAGFSEDLQLSTVICQAEQGFPSFHDPRNTEDPRPRFSNVRKALQFNRPYCGWISDVVISLLSDDFDVENRILTPESLPAFRLQAGEFLENLCYYREFKVQESEYTMTFMEQLHVSPSLFITQFTQTRLVKKEEKLPLEVLKRPSCKAAQERWLSKDSLAVSDYRFNEVEFDREIHRRVFEEPLSMRLNNTNILRFSL